MCALPVVSKNSRTVKDTNRNESKTSPATCAQYGHRCQTLSVLSIKNLSKSRRQESTKNLFHMFVRFHHLSKVVAGSFCWNVQLMKTLYSFKYRCLCLSMTDRSNKQEIFTQVTHFYQQEFLTKN